LHRAPQSRSVRQATVGLFTHKPVDTLQVSVGISHVTNPALPQTDLAAQRTTLPLQLVGTVPSCDRRFTTWATQLT
jgi:hypothetical protein